MNIIKNAVKEVAIPKRYIVKNIYLIITPLQKKVKNKIKNIRDKEDIL